MEVLDLALVSYKCFSRMPVVPVNTLYGLRVDIEGHEGVHGLYAATLGRERLHAVGKRSKQIADFSIDVMGSVVLLRRGETSNEPRALRQNRERDLGTGLDFTLAENRRKLGRSTRDGLQVRLVCEVHCCQIEIGAAIDYM